MIRLSCPSCNTRFALPAVPADRRASCPRCGDVFPVRTWEETGEASQETGNGQPGHHPPPTPHHSRTARRRAVGRWSVRRTVTVALAMGLVGLLAGLGFYYVKGGFRAKPTPEADAPPSIDATPPAQLTGLGYLPANTAIAFALQPGPALAYAERTKQDPRELFTRAGLPRGLFDAIGNLGLTLPQIDHLAGGTSADEVRFTLVLVLRRAPGRPPIDEDEFLRRLKARPLPGAKARYAVELAGLPLTMARVSSTVWVFGFDERKDLEAVTRGGYGPGGKQFSPALAEMIAQRVPPDAAAWVATDDELWANKPLVKFALGPVAGKRDVLPLLAKGRAAVAALSLADPPRLRLFVKAADEPTAQQVRAYFAKRAAADDQVRHGGAGELAFFDMPIDPATALATLQQFLSDAGR